MINRGIDANYVAYHAIFNGHLEFAKTLCARHSLKDSVWVVDKNHVNWEYPISILRLFLQVSREISKQCMNNKVTIKKKIIFLPLLEESIECYID